MRKIEEKLKYQFQNSALLEQALKHKSLGEPHNERLEFLGDSVLQLAVSQKLYELFPDKDEGQLSQLRASLVNQNYLAKKANELDLGSELLRDEKNVSTRMLCSTFEAILGAQFLDSNFQVVKKQVDTIFALDFQSFPVDQIGEVDSKTKLQEALQKQGTLPRYQLDQADGPAHRPQFTVSVFFKEEKLATAVGMSKKEAEHAAALLAFQKLQSEMSPPWIEGPDA